jgi:hypothetical protein
MIIIKKKSIKTLVFLLFFVGVICHHSTILSSGIVSHIPNSKHGSYYPAKISDRYGNLTLNETSSGNLGISNQNGEMINTEKKDSEINFEKYTPRNLKEVISIYYEGSKFVNQEKAFARVIKWKEDFEDIAKKYRYVDWKKLSAIIKAETQGKTGEQVSYAKAVGMPQIKYQGAWAFVWDAMFSERIKQGSGYVKDYYNANIRARYGIQLTQIRKYLEDNSILVNPVNLSKADIDYKKARSKSWDNLKMHLRKEFKPGEYQVAVDIAAMYIDHLIDIFKKLEKQVAEIKQYIEHNGIISFNNTEFSRIKMTRWQRIKKHLRKNFEYTGNTNMHELTLVHLNNILNKLRDPNIYCAAYNFGIRKVLEYTESGRNLPNEIVQYVKKVSHYIKIFREIERYNVYT